MLDPFTESSGIFYKIMLEEVWEDIPGWEGKYQVSNLARVRSIFRYRKILSQYIDKWGYYEVNLYCDNKTTHKKVHRLVAEAFIDNPDNKPCVDHIDTNKLNNLPDNLRWCTYKENANNPLTLKHLSESQTGEKNYWFGKKQPESMRRKRSVATHGEKAYWYGKKRDAETKEKLRRAAISRGWIGEKHPRAKPVLQISLSDNSVIKKWSCAAEAHRSLGVSTSGICACCKGQALTAGGFRWEYANDGTKFVKCEKKSSYESNRHSFSYRRQYYARRH